MQNRTDRTETKAPSVVDIIRREYEDTLKSIEDAATLIKQGKNMRGIDMFRDSYKTLRDLREILSNYYQMIYSSQELLNRLNPECLKNVKLLHPREQYLELQAGDTQTWEKMFLQDLAKAGFRKEHWLLDSLTLSEIEYMLSVLESVIEHDYVPFEGTTKGKDEQFEQPMGSIPTDVKLAVWWRDQGKCVECGSREKLEYDQIVPLSKGRLNTERNVQLLCQVCRRKKRVVIAE